MTTLTDEALLAWLDSQYQPGIVQPTEQARQLAARFRELLALQEWQPIDSLAAYAPSPKECFDVWVEPPKVREGPYLNKVAQAGRKSDVYVSPSGYILDRRGQWIEGRWFYDDKGERCVDPNDKSDHAFIITHWRPLPAPPKDD